MARKKSCQPRKEPNNVTPSEDTSDKTLPAQPRTRSKTRVQPPAECSVSVLVPIPPTEQVPCAAAKNAPKKNPVDQSNDAAKKKTKAQSAKTAAKKKSVTPKKKTGSQKKTTKKAVTSNQHELDEELYDELVNHIDLNLEEDDDFIPASGVSVEAAHSSTGQDTSDIQSPTSYPCETCPSVLKTKHGFQRHIMGHRIKESNARRPSGEILRPLMESFTISCLNEILLEHGEEKKKFVQDILKSSELTENSDWNGFILSVSEPILTSISKPTKMLPANQYEEQLVSLNRLLNDDEKFLVHLNQIMSLTNVGSHPKSMGKVVLFRLLSKLVDKVCSFVFSEMKQKQVEEGSSNNTDIISDTQETAAFETHMKMLLRKYYIKGLNNGSKLWLARCACIRQRFVESCEVDTGPSVDDMISSDAWDKDQDGVLKLKLNSKILTVFIGLESIIESLIVQNKTVDSENILTILLNKNEKAELLDLWHSLTSPFLSEMESLVFMNDILSIVSTLSLKLEVGKIRNIDSQCRIQKYALRTDLKRN